LRTSKVSNCKTYDRRVSGRRIAQDIEVIRAVLKRRGYRIRKQPKQAAWAIYVTDDKFYLLTFQPAPISAWVLHPQDNDSTRATLSNLIQRALAKQPAGNTRRNS
jgi:hypothetical protein